MRQALRDAGLEQQVRIMSAGLHASAGRDAHLWAQEASADLGISLAGHRAKPLTQDIVEQAGCILAMDFQNKAELLTRYPRSREKSTCSAHTGKGTGNIWRFQIPISGIWRQPASAPGNCERAFAI